MRRVIKPLASFGHDYDRLGLRGTAVAKKVGSVIASLAKADSLPGPTDAMTLLYDEARGISTLTYVRRVRGANLWIWYTAKGDTLTLHTLTAMPP
jgi:hypothetical protein